MSGINTPLRGQTGVKCRAEILCESMCPLESADHFRERRPLVTSVYFGIASVGCSKYAGNMSSIVKTDQVQTIKQ